MTALQGTIYGANIKDDRHQVKKGGLEHEGGGPLGKTVTFLGITEPILF